jgi:hypothetical protein
MVGIMIGTLMSVSCVSIQTFKQMYQTIHSFTKSSPLMNEVNHHKPKIFFVAGREERKRTHLLDQRLHAVLLGRGRRAARDGLEAEGEAGLELFWMVVCVVS